MCLLLIVPEFKWKDLVGSLIDESLTRSVFWIHNNYPNLEEQENKSEFTEEEITSRISKSFSTSSSKNILNNFFFFFFYFIFLFFLNYFFTSWNKIYLLPKILANKTFERCRTKHTKRNSSVV